MKTKLFITMVVVAIIALAIIGCKQDDPPPQEQAKVKPDTPRTLAFGANCKVTIKSADTFTNAEWNTLCDKVVAAVKKGYDSAPNDAVKTNIENHFNTNTVSVDLLKSATYDCEVKSGESSIMYLKANGSTIDGISGNNLFNAIAAMMASANSFHTP